MANLAIKGHATRGEEVIEILEMLGGKNETHIKATVFNAFYYINEDGKMYLADKYSDMSNFVIYTLEEFLEKFPYKVGDKVQHKDATSCGSIYEVEKMRWEEDTVKYTVRLFGCNYKSSTLPSEYLQPYKKETMRKEIYGAIVDRFICLEGYDFYDDKGNIIDTKEITMKKKQPKYPNTYEECCKVLFPSSIQLGKILTSGYNFEILKKFGELIICRDAYWEIAGDWKPNFSNVDEKFIIACYYGKIYTTIATNYNRVLVFPTEEMRDAFYENFKELIEECKELL